MNNSETSLVPERHPMHGLRDFLLQQQQQQQAELILEFSRYVHLGLGRTLSRETFHVEARNVHAAWLADEICGLSEGQELALHSKVVQKDRIFHIPMVDFAHVDSLKILLIKTQTVRQSLPVDIT